ncbi:MAG: hypothetical protein DRH70_10190, partial [Candidatus Coatesbacteria bacterium]
MAFDNTLLLPDFESDLTPEELTDAASQSIVIIPTYNERENIELIVSRLFRLYPTINVLIVDDNSP